jgi:hypothetical protein
MKDRYIPTFIKNILVFSPFYIHLSRNKFPNFPAYEILESKLIHVRHSISYSPDQESLISDNRRKFFKMFCQTFSATWSPIPLVLVFRFFSSLIYPFILFLRIKKSLKIPKG